MTPTRRETPKRGPRGDLSLDRVLAAGTAVLERAGMSEFSIRAVARELGVAPNALYTYAPSRDALLEDIADAALQRLDLQILSRPLVGGESPRARLLEFAEHVLGDFRAHPGLARVLFDRPIGGPAAYRLNEALIASIHSCGPSLPVAGRIAHALTALVFGHAVIEVTDDARTRWPPVPDPETIPITTAAAVRVPDIDDVFSWSVDRLLVGCGC